MRNTDAADDSEDEYRSDESVDSDVQIAAQDRLREDDDDKLVANMSP